MPYTHSIEKESTGSFPHKITFFEYLCVFILVIYAGRANKFVESGFIAVKNVGVFIPIILSVILAIKWKVKFDGHFYFLTFCFGIYFLAISIKYTEIHPSFFLSYFFNFFVAYIIIKAIKFNLFKIYEYILFYLAFVGLLFWGIQIILGGDTLFNLFSRIFGFSFSSVTGHGLTAIIYSLQPSDFSLLYGFTIPRNCGFAWEPGVFAAYLCLAIFINLFITNSDPNSKKRRWVLIMALLSTLSTTGYVIFLVMILYYLLNKKLNVIILLLPIAVIALICLSTLPFMSKKLIQVMDETKQVDQLLEETYGVDFQSNPQRFTSIMISVKDFANNPILGMGGNNEASWTYKMGSRISTVSGIGNLLAQFGVMGFIFFVVISYKSSLFFSNYYDYKGKLLLFFIILFISVSYSIIFTPVILIFWMFQLFEPEEPIQKEVKNMALDTKNNEDHLLNH
jgi:hypothetical protein